MTLVEKKRVESRLQARAHMGAWLIGLLVFGLAIATGIAVWVIGQEETADIVGDPAASVAAVAERSIFTPREQILMELAREGYIPEQSVDWYTIEVKKLVSEGLVPAEALYPARLTAEPLYTHHEQLMKDLATQGLIPMDSVDWYDMEVRRLANEGFIPKDAAR